MADPHQYASDEGFPSFGPMFAKAGDVGRYLKLLNLGDGAPEAIAVAKECADRAPDLRRELEALLRGENWRPHLVGAIAMMASVRSEQTLGYLWERLERGSWVVPQLAATAELIDRRFTERGADLLALLCDKIRPDDQASLADAPPTDPRAFRDDGLHNDGKTVAALAALLDAPIHGSAQRLADQDRDRAGAVAKGWQLAVVGAFDSANVIIR